jgi:hypothetical protein
VLFAWCVGLGCRTSSEATYDGAHCVLLHCRWGDAIYTEDPANGRYYMFINEVRVTETDCFAAALFALHIVQLSGMPMLAHAGENGRAQQYHEAQVDVYTDADGSTYSHVTVVDTVQQEVCSWITVAAEARNRLEAHTFIPTAAAPPEPCGAASADGAMMLAASYHSSSPCHLPCRSWRESVLARHWCTATASLSRTSSGRTLTQSEQQVFMIPQMAHGCSCKCCMLTGSPIIVDLALL